MNIPHSIPGPPPSRVVLAICLLPFLPACDRPRDDSPVTARDSAGVRILEARFPVWTDSTAWRIDPDPVLDLHALDSTDAFNFLRLRGMRRLPGGTIAVANAGTNEIRLFSSLGDHVGTVGGEGEGPGEFSNLQRIEVVGDSILGLDYDGRVSVFGPFPDPVLVRTMRPHPGVQGLHFLGDGTLVAQVIMSVPPPSAPGIVRTPHALLRLDSAGVLLDSIGTTAGFEEYIDNVSFSGTPLFPKRSLVTTHGGRIYHGPSDLMEVRELGPDGALLRILRIPGYPLALTPEQVEVERRARLASVPEVLRQGIANMPAPTTRPAYRDMLLDPAGAIWLRPYDGVSEGGTPLDWLVLAADGTWLGGVEVPTNFRIWEIGMDEVLGSRIDELGRQRPQVLRLRRGGGGR